MTQEFVLKVMFPLIPCSPLGLTGLGRAAEEGRAEGCLSAVVRGCVPSWGTGAGHTGPGYFLAVSMDFKPFIIISGTLFLYLDRQE